MTSADRVPAEREQAPASSDERPMTDAHIAAFEAFDFERLPGIHTALRKAVDAALASSEAEVRRKALEQAAQAVDKLYATEAPACACPGSARSCGYRYGIGTAADAVRALEPGS